MNKILLFVFTLLLAGQALHAQCPTNNRYYVDADATSGANDGTSWMDAFTDLQTALFEARFNCMAVTEIWVAEGTYKPTPGTDRNASFVMQNDLAIYGGFDGTENMLSDRDWAANPTILSGEIGGGGNTDNSLHVIDNSGNSLLSTAVLDGFTVTGGYGAAKGGGMYNENNSSPTVVNCIFSANNATNGGGMGNFSFSSPTVINCVFSGNSGAIGGGMGNFNFSSPQIINCTFSGNTVFASGGAIYNDDSSPTVTNSILWGNSSDIVNAGSSNPGVTYSIIQSGYGGVGNISLDPAFVNQPAVGLGNGGDLRLQPNSCAIDNGLNSAIPAGTVTDLSNNDRIFNSGTVDMGAYEYQGSYVGVVPPPVTTGNGLDFDGNDDHVKIFSACGANNFFPGGDAITVEYWFKGSNPQSAVRFQNGGGFIVAGWNGDTNNPMQHILSNDGGTNGVSLGTGFDDGNWHHIAFTWQRNTANGFKSYLDGVLVEERQSSDSPVPSFNSGFYLGSISGTSEFTTGTLDKVKIWTVAQTQAEIQQSIAGQFTGPQPGLLHAFDFDHGVANANNPGIEAVANLAFPDAPGELQNFTLNGSTSNWVEGKNDCLVGSVLYVDADASGTNDGSSWANAFTDLQDALSLAASCPNVEQIWVATGTYKPSAYPTPCTGCAVPRDYTFQLQDGISLYGGFAGTETMLSQRD
ncbi:MAG: LamG-like jellyroll fold domain-containing protein, partial [Phaeodactylibacter sp.]|uniref:LamG-like jellyroll fold domain-containing protein n=1 Tax=Phaeodactylibacter sp. TaxID=1940289 RepID=UPI0032ED083C